MMKKMLFAIIAVLVLATGVTLLASNDCAQWQDRYKQFLYSETMKNTPLILPEGGIEAIIGPRPVGCEVPPYELTQADIDRYRAQGIGPNEFLEESRAAFRRTSGFKNL